MIVSHKDKGHTFFFSSSFTITWHPIVRMHHAFVNHSVLMQMEFAIKYVQAHVQVYLFDEYREVKLLGHRVCTCVTWKSTAHLSPCAFVVKCKNIPPTISKSACFPHHLSIFSKYGSLLIFKRKVASHYIFSR